MADRRAQDLETLRALLRLPPELWTLDAPLPPLPEEVERFVRRADRRELQALLIMTLRRLQARPKRRRR